jgi:hypothetical protein
MSEGKTFGQADVRQALDGLSANVKGCWSMEEHELRQLLGNTNYNVIQHWLEQANGALAAAPEPPSPSPELREALEALAQCGGLIEGMIETHAIKSDVATAVVDRARSILDKYPQD